MAEESIKLIIDMALNLKTDIVREVFFKVIRSLEFGKREKTSDYCYMNEHKETETKIFIELDTKRIYCNVVKDLFFTFRYDGEVFVNTTNEAMWKMFTNHLQDFLNARDAVEVEETKKIINKILDLEKEVLIMKIAFLDQTFDITLPCDTELFWVAATNNNRLMVFASKPECKDGSWHGNIIPQDSIQYINRVPDYTKSLAAFKTTIKAEPFAEDNYSELLKYIDEHKPTNETIPEFAFIYMVRQQLWSLEFVEYGDIVIIDSSDYEAIGMIAVDTDASRIFFKLKLFNMGILINFNKDEVSWVNNIDDDYSDDYLDKAEAYSCKPINLPSAKLSIYKMLAEALVKEMQRINN